MTTYPDNLCAELECGACKEVFSDPVSLPCKHLFCRQCLITAYKRNIPNCCNADWSILRCPTCGRHQLTNLTLINKIPVNIKLRNIVDSLSGIKDRCKAHKKKLELFCIDCIDGKCLTCFLRDCHPKSHHAEDLQDAAKTARSALSDRLVYSTDQINVAIKSKDQRTRALLAKLKPLFTPDVSDLLEKMQSLVLKLIDDEREMTNDVCTKLTLALKSSDTRLVKAEREIATITDPPSDDVLSTLSRISEVMNSSTQHMKQVLQKHGIEANCTHERETAEPDALECNTTSAQQAIAVDSKLLATEKPAVLVEGLSRTITPLYSLKFSGSLVNSVSFLWTENNFVASTADGCLRIGQEETHQSFCGKHVKAVCAISSQKLLVLIRNSLFIYETKEKSHEQERVFAIPMSIKFVNGYDFECIGVTRPDNHNYVVSENKGATIHVWNSQRRKWHQAVDLPTLTSQPASQLSHKMCVSGSDIYITIFHLGEVRCMNIDEKTKWVNRQACRKPNGIAVEKDNIYVCEGEIFLRSIVVLAKEFGFLRYVITSPSIQRPYIIAAGNGKLAVLERFFKHNMMVSSINVLLFDLQCLKELEVV